MNFGIWQIVWIAVMALSMGVNLAKHGKVNTKPNSFWAALIAFGIHLFILIKGGFFS